MTKLLEQAIETARRLPAGDQDDIARAIIELTGIGDAGQVTLTLEERAAIGNSKAAAAREESATDKEVRAVWVKRRR